MSQFTSHHFADAQGRPEGGQTYATGLAIAWQRGPLGRGEERLNPNGCFVETVIEAAIDRIEFYQKSPFRCDRNEEALTHLKAAVAALNSRTLERETRGVEGTYEA